MKKGILLFHQGWTDIINSLALINYYNEKYDELYLIIRIDAKRLIDFYTRNLIKINIIYLDHIYLQNDEFVVNYIKSHNEFNGCDYLFHGYSDNYREDEFKNIFSKSYLKSIFFVNAFYQSYNIDYQVRVNYFHLQRDFELEDVIYNKFIKDHGENYILTHEINVANKLENINYINLNQISYTFFDYIKVLENAKEFHLLDSVWGAIIYLLDAKYMMFQDKSIFVYCNRHYIEMFNEPIQLNNWTII